jgi:hypothetical protein
MTKLIDVGYLQSAALRLRMVVIGYDLTARFAHQLLPLTMDQHFPERGCRRGYSGERCSRFGVQSGTGLVENHTRAQLDNGAVVRIDYSQLLM